MWDEQDDIKIPLPYQYQSDSPTVCITNSRRGGGRGHGDGDDCVAGVQVGGHEGQSLTTQSDADTILHANNVGDEVEPAIRTRLMKHRWIAFVALCGGALLLAGAVAALVAAVAGREEEATLTIRPVSFHEPAASPSHDNVFSLPSFLPSLSDPTRPPTTVSSAAPSFPSSVSDPTRPPLPSPTSSPSPDPPTAGPSTSTRTADPSVVQSTPPSQQLPPQGPSITTTGAPAVIQVAPIFPPLFAPNFVFPTPPPLQPPLQQQPIAGSTTTTVFYVTAHRPNQQELTVFENNLPLLPTDADFMVHLGDWNSPSITGCSEESYIEVETLFNRSSVPVYFTVGDNEVSVCKKLAHEIENPHRLNSLFLSFFFS